eukprot:6201138-Pleurochrysis_carterae.AAC.1
MTAVHQTLFCPSKGRPGPLERRQRHVAHGAAAATRARDAHAHAPRGEYEGVFAACKHSVAFVHQLEVCLCILLAWAFSGFSSTKRGQSITACV